VGAGESKRGSRSRRRVLDRVAAIRRASGPDATDPGPAHEPDELEGDELLEDLRRRIDHLEQEVEGLQDAIHRESRRRDEEMAALRRQLQPGTLARSLSDDARKRGL
jgi:vacuolar-type H+-ATPase subunit I/STV1